MPSQILQLEESKYGSAGSWKHHRCCCCVTGSTTWCGKELGGYFLEITVRSSVHDTTVKRTWESLGHNEQHVDEADKQFQSWEQHRNPFLSEKGFEFRLLLWIFGVRGCNKLQCKWPPFAVCSSSWTCPPCWDGACASWTLKGTVALPLSQGSCAGENQIATPGRHLSSLIQILKRLIEFTHHHTSVPLSDGLDQYYSVPL